MGLVQVMASVTGPVVGGWFTDHAAWRSLAGWQCGLAATLPLVLLGLGLAAVSMPTRVRPRTCSAGPWWRVRASDLVLPRRGSGLNALVAMAFLAGGLTLVVVTYLPWALSAFHHQGAAQIGRQLVPLLVASAVGSAAGGAMATRRGALAACWLVLVGAVPMALVGAEWALVSASSLVGLGCGAVLPIVLTRVQAAAPGDQLAASSSLVQLARHAGAAVLVPTVGLWPSTMTPPHAGIAIVITVTLAATSGLVLARSTS